MKYQAIYGGIRFFSYKIPCISQALAETGIFILLRLGNTFDDLYS